MQILDLQIGKQMDTQVDRQINRYIDRQKIDIFIHRQIDRYIYTQIDRQIDRQTKIDPSNCLYGSLMTCFILYDDPKRRLSDNISSNLINNSYIERVIYQNKQDIEL